MESRTVTVLHAELPGFVELSGKLASREFNAILSETHDLTDATIKLHQGILTGFTGDTFQAVFSHLKSSGTPALLAIETVNEFRERLETLLAGKNLPAAIGFKAGIASGEATIGEIESAGEKQITVMGQAVNFASRLMGFAENGQALVNGTLFEKLKDQFDFNRLEPLPIRGSKETLPVYELLGRKRKKMITDTVPERMISSEMVGRVKELNLIEEKVKQLLTGKGSVVNVAGGPGIGKSRLIAELKARDWMGKMAVLEGRAQSMGRNLSFHPLIYILKTWAGILEEEPAGVATGKLYDSILRVTKEQTTEIFPFIATMMGLPLEGKHRERVAGIEGEALEKLILKNLRDLLASAAAVRPLAILLEDLHWADRSTILFLESMFRMVRQHPILFINIFRPGYEETGDYLLKYLEEQLPGHHSTVILEPLNGNESRELIGNLLNRTMLPAEISDLIIRKTEGNPFFIEEIIRSFIDTGIVEIRENSFRVTEKINETDIPASINEVILARIDKLDEKTRELLKTASVIGRNFYYKVLEEVAGTIGEMDERLEYLKEVQLISESKKKEEIEYLFKHALAQQATYESIMQNTKKELHLKIARSIEKVFAGNLHEFYGTLAWHYEMAENREKTLEYLLKAGDEALKSAATLVAINFYKNALKINVLISDEQSSDQKLRDIYYKLGFAFHTRGMSKEALEAVDKALKLYRYGIPGNKAVIMAIFIRNFLRFLVAVYNEKYFFRKLPSEETEAILYLAYYRGEALAMKDPKRFFIETFYFTRLLIRSDLSKSPIAAALFVGFSVLFFWTGISLKISTRIIKIAKNYVKQKDTYAYLKFRYLQKMQEYHCGFIREDDDQEDFINTCIRKGACWDATTYLLYSGFGMADTGKRKQCDEAAGKLLQVSSHFENSHAKMQYYRYLSCVFVKFRELDNSFGILREGTELPEKAEYESLASVIYSNLSILHTLKGEMDEAKEALQEVERSIHKIKMSKPFYCTYLMGKARFELAMMQNEKDPGQANPKELKGMIRELTRTAKKFRGVLPEAMLIAAQVDRFLGRKHKAIKTLGKALQLAENSGAHLESARINFELGKCLSDPKVKGKKLVGNPASYYLENAHRMFEEMNLQWDLEELRNFMGNSL